MPKKRGQKERPSVLKQRWLKQLNENPPRIRQAAPKGHLTRPEDVGKSSAQIMAEMEAEARAHRRESYRRTRARRRAAGARPREEPRGPA